MPDSDEVRVRLRFLEKYVKGRCLWLLVALVVFILTHHLVVRNPGLSMVANSLVLIAGIYAVSARKMALRIGIGIAAAQIACSVLAVQIGGAAFVRAGVALLALFYGYTLLCVLAYVMRRTKVTPDKLYAAAAVYLLIGFTCSVVYGLVFAINPASFAYESTREGMVPDFLYFSFITLLSVGYGDITPVAGIARSVAVVEGVSGALYLALLVARLVGLYGGRGSDDNDE